MRQIASVIPFLAILACGMPGLVSFAQDTRTFPDQDETKPAEGNGKVVDVDLKVLRKKLGAKTVNWDPKSGVLTLAYDFNKGQDKDWEIEEDCVSRPTSLKGIRLAAATKIVHKVVFVEGSCAFQYAITKERDKGMLLSAGDITVGQHVFNGRHFVLNDRDLDLGIGSEKIKQFAITLQCKPNRCSVKVNRSEVAFGHNSSQPFRFALHGGDNSGEFGSLVISGKPDSDWLVEVMKKE